FFQAEDGIRDKLVTGVQTCALPISLGQRQLAQARDLELAVCAYDFTVMAGSMGMTGELKVTRLRELALSKRIPFIWLLDSAGARIQEAVGSLFAGSGHLFREEVVMSGVIPQIAALMGPC